MDQTLAMVLYYPAPDAMPPGSSSRDEAEHSQRLVTDRLYLSGWVARHISIYPAVTRPSPCSVC